MMRVLVVDDEESDWVLLRLAFKHAGIPVQLAWARDGLEALEDLSAESRRRTGPEKSFTVLVLLDLKMPGMDGFEVLGWWRTQPHLMELPMVVFSSSANPADMARAGELGAREYVVKPTGFRELKACIRRLSDRYVLAATLPLPSSMGWEGERPREPKQP